MDTVFCIEPCNKTLPCGHHCAGRCGEPCKCPACLAAIKESAEKRIKEIEAKMADPSTVFRLEELKNSRETKAEYTQVTDRVEKYVQSMHTSIPSVTKIWRVTNLELEIKFEKAKARAFGSNIDQKFHGTSDAGIDGITRNGFKKPGPPPPGQRPGMYGQGIYFATDSSKSAQEIYTKGSKKLLLCDVLLGRSMNVEKANNTLDGKYIRDREFDSVYAPRGTKASGGVDNDEFVIYDPDQALPR